MKDVATVESTCNFYYCTFEFLCGHQLPFKIINNIKKIDK